MADDRQGDNGTATDADPVAQIREIRRLVAERRAAELRKRAGGRR